ncbi:MAG: threonine/serine dehydratase [Acidobacteriota bacterium]|nr:threonine/serine dehydratase [Acidobacteriota bacterium]
MALAQTARWRLISPGRIAAPPSRQTPPPHAPTLALVRDAAARIADHVVHSPVRALASTDARFLVKLELLQPTGSFKIRGAANHMLALTDAQRTAGVVTASSGNHGIAVAQLAARLGVRAVICVPRDTDASKLTALRRSGAEIRAESADYDASAALADELARERDLCLVHPFDDLRVIAGHATIGLELAEQAPDAAAVLIPLSGGGLASGVASALRALAPHMRLIGVSAANAPVMYRSLLAGRPAQTREQPTLAAALSGGLGDRNRHSFAIVSALLDEVLLVPEREIAAAMVWGEEQLDLPIEGAAAAALAALPLTRPPGGERVVAIVTGGNVQASTCERARALVEAVGER